MFKKLSFAAAAIACLASYGSLRAEDKPAAPAAPKLIELPAADLPAPDKDGFITIFNGKDLTWWTGLEEYWEVKDGVISGHEEKAKSKQTFLIFAKPVSDFELHCSFKFGTINGKVEGNSGIQFRSKVMDAKTCRVGGYQADFDAGNGYTGIIYDEAGGAGGRGIMSNRGESTVWDADNKRANTKVADTNAIKAKIKVGEWNDVVLIANGDHITYSINGTVTTELTDKSPKFVKEGVLAFQLHAGFTMDINIKDVKIKFLDKK